MSLAREQNLASSIEEFVAYIFSKGGIENYK